MEVKEAYLARRGTYHHCATYRMRAARFCGNDREARGGA